jgi:hypothetical protein
VLSRLTSALTRSPPRSELAEAGVSDVRLTVLILRERATSRAWNACPSRLKKSPLSGLQFIRQAMRCLAVASSKSFRYQREARRRDESEQVVGRDDPMCHNAPDVLQRRPFAAGVARIRGKRRDAAGLVVAIYGPWAKVPRLSRRSAAIVEGVCDVIPHLSTIVCDLSACETTRS